MEYENRDVPGFENEYYLDPQGLNIVSKHTNRPLKLRCDKRGYPEVLLSKGGKDYYRKVHRLFAEAYHPNPDNLPQVNHRDENKLNFSPDNLEWCNESYNINYGTGNKRRSDKHTNMSKPWVADKLGKTTLAIDKDGNETVYPCAREAARQLNIRQSKVADVLCGLRKTTHGYTFRYIENERI